MTDSPSTPIAALRRKYERIRVLREAHQRTDEPDPREAMAALADDFPGALKELDRLTIAQIDDRVARLLLAEEDPARVEGWMIAFATFHRFARGALAVKRWLAAGNLADETLFRAALPTLREEAALFLADLEVIADPPDGRLMPIVYRRAADELGVTEPELRALLRTTRP